MIVYLLGVAIFSTHDLKGSKDEVFPSKVEYHMFREDEKDKFIKIKVRSEGPFYIFVSHQENIGKKTHILQYLDSKIILGHFLKKSRENKVQPTGRNWVESERNSSWPLDIITNRVH